MSRNCYLAILCTVTLVALLCLAGKIQLLEFSYPPSSMVSYCYEGSTSKALREGNESIADDFNWTETKRNCSGYISVQLHPTFRRLGNNMFTYASLLGIAVKNGCEPQLCIYMRTADLSNIEGSFNTLGVPIVPDFMPNSIHFDFEKKSTRMHVSPDRWNLSCNRNYVLGGYYQSWRYFDPQLRNLLKHKEFYFKPEIAKSAQEYLATVVNSTMQKHELTTSVYYEIVTVHIRVWPKTFTINGHLSTNVGSLMRGVETIRTDFDQYSRECHSDKTDRLIIYLLIGGDGLRDDFSGSLTTRNSSFKEEFVTRINEDRAVDLQLMALSDRIFLSASGSTFAWWGAYLSDAKKVYYTEHAAMPDSHAYKKMNEGDYFLPDWFPIRE